MSNGDDKPLGILEVNLKRTGRLRKKENSICNKSHGKNGTAETLLLLQTSLGADLDPLPGAKGATREQND